MRSKAPLLPIESCAGFSVERDPDVPAVSAGHQPGVPGAGPAGGPGGGASARPDHDKSTPEQTHLPARLYQGELTVNASCATPLKTVEKGGTI